MFTASGFLPTPMTRFTLLCSAWLLTIASAPAMLTLTIDTGNLTVAWSGSVVSDAIPTPAPFDQPTIIVSTAHTSNPTGPGPYVQLGAMGIDMTFATSIGTGTVNSASPRLYVDGTNDLVSEIVASIIDINGGGSSTLTLTGDGVAYDYGAVGLSAAQLMTLANMSGETLRFYRTDNPGTDFGTAGNVLVIPEPAVFALGSLGLLALLTRRRRCR